MSDVHFGNPTGADSVESQAGDILDKFDPADVAGIR